MNIETETEMLIVNEGMVLHEYRNHLSYSKIAVERLIEKDRDGIIEEEAKYLLTNDIQTVCERLDRNWPCWRDLSKDRQHVMIDLSFNLGNRLGQFKNFLANLQAGNYQAASDDLMDSKYAEQVPNRATRNRDLIRGE